MPKVEDVVPRNQLTVRSDKVHVDCPAVTHGYLAATYSGPCSVAHVV